MLSFLFIFWFCLAVLFYCYLGYGIILYLINFINNRFSARPSPPVPEWPRVTLVIAAYNEATILDRKIRNSQAIDYPAGKLDILIVTDGSDDGSADMASRYHAVKFLHQPERKGKMAAIRRAMEFVDTPLVVFSDANTNLNRECLRRIVLHYADPVTGGVAGEKKISAEQHHSAVGEAEGLYWKYESFLKRQDDGLYTVVGAAGELFSIRTELFRAPGDEVILDDFLISMQVCLQGYRIRYEPAAYATESPSLNLGEEEKRKVRISAGAYQSVGYLKDCLNVFKHPRLGFQYISRRLLRWIVCPPFLLIILGTNLFLALRPQLPAFYVYLLLGQSLFYLLALNGWLLVRRGRRAGIMTIPFYFVFMNYCLFRGFFRFLGGKYSVLWEKSKRQ